MVRVTYTINGTTESVDYEAPSISAQLFSDNASIIKLRNNPGEKPYRMIMFAHTEMIDRHIK
jgi:hypothetical protein